MSSEGHLHTEQPPVESLATLMQGIGRSARAAAEVLAFARPEAKNRALGAAADAIRAHRHRILAANERDVQEAGAAALSGPLLDRLRLDEKRVLAIATGLETIARLADPIGTVLAEWTRPNGMVIQRVRVPLGVVGIVYESRPNVTADAGALCLKSGNAAILRGGSESTRSSLAIHACLQEGLARPDRRSRGRGFLALRDERQHRCDRAARRQGSHRASSTGSACARDRPSRWGLSRVRRS
jgi:glutamate-5-semialdehyde dehydrogenase